VPLIGPILLAQRACDILTFERMLFEKLSFYKKFPLLIFQANVIQPISSRKNLSRIVPFALYGIYFFLLLLLSGSSLSWGVLGSLKISNFKFGFSNSQTGFKESRFVHSCITLLLKLVSFNKTYNFQVHQNSNTLSLR
jgi:hypothetical protein